MKALIVVVALSVVLAASPAFAQAPAAQTPAKPAPAAPAPAAPAPAPVQAPAQPPAPKPFPQGAKVAYVVLQRIANESADGRVATTRIQALQQKKAA
jgi:2-oxoglutarate dehydrogenase E2 component (dihydrolipoamide succinyltransferase)